MALVKETIKQGFLDAFNAVKDQTENQDQALETVASMFADTVMEAIKSMAIIYTTGLANSGGPVTGDFGYTIK
jgi:hypothetical protein